MTFFSFENLNNSLKTIEREKLNRSFKIGVMIGFSTLLLSIFSWFKAWYGFLTIIFSATFFLSFVFLEVYTQSDYFTCLDCKKVFYKDYQVGKEICKECWDVKVF